MSAPHTLEATRRRKGRGAFFTPAAIADYLAAWAVDADPDACVLDPTCGEAVFLQAAGRRLKESGARPGDLDRRVFGVDVDAGSVARSRTLLRRDGLDATLLVGDFFEMATPDRLGCELPEMDAVIGNPPFVRYQKHAGLTRRKSAAAALAQGVRLSGLASSWAALLVHACGFLRPNGRLAMVLPAELLTVGYAEPIRSWLRRRFGAVHLIMFERLQFEDALEKVVLVIARGSGGCDAFSLLHVEDAQGLPDLKLFGPNHFSVAPAERGKWTDLLLPVKQRQAFKRVTGEHFVSLAGYGTPELGTVTGANSYFALSDTKRREYGLHKGHVVPICPPGTRHLKGLSFTRRDWEGLRNSGDSVWLLYPDPDDDSPPLRRYRKYGERLGVPGAYKCRVRDPWWRPPVVSPPDLFFTYMSHRHPRLIQNSAGVSFLNSMHGVRLRSDAPQFASFALPLLCLNSVTLLGAELFGRSYGGGILKMEPREAAILPVPGPSALERAWLRLGPERPALDRQIRAGRWASVVEQIDDALLQATLGVPAGEVTLVREAARSLRERRIGPGRSNGG